MDTSAPVLYLAASVSRAGPRGTQEPQVGIEESPPCHLAPHRRPHPPRPRRAPVPIRICFYLQRFHQVYASVPTIYKILKRHGVPRVSMKRYRPGPRRRREFTVPGQSVQVDVKHLKLGGRRFYQFTAVDEATRYRVLRIYTHSCIPNAIAFMDEVRQRLPMAIQRVQTVCYELLVKPVSSLMPAPLGCPIE